MIFPVFLNYTDSLNYHYLPSKLVPNFAKFLSSKSKNKSPAQEKKNKVAAVRLEDVFWVKAKSFDNENSNPHPQTTDLYVGIILPKNFKLEI
jgi:hypothetical protein